MLLWGSAVALKGPVISRVNYKLHMLTPVLYPVYELLKVNTRSVISK